MKLISLLIGCVASIALFVAGIVVAMTVPVAGASGPSGGAGPSTSIAPSVEATTMAVPSIRGAVPLYPGEAPNSNPQATVG